MQEYWESDPNKRPTASNIYEKLNNIEIIENENPTEIIKSSDIRPIITNNSDKNISLSEIIKFAKSTRSLKNQSFTSTLGKYYIIYYYNDH